ncbi:MAG: uracil phosphoribosyltransferase [bacterium]|nr:uracil phosphoribosyltransferase [bacterium]
MRSDSEALIPTRELTEHIALAHTRVHERDKRRKQRAMHAAMVSADVCRTHLHALRQRMAADLQSPASQRTSAFRPIDEYDLGLLERQMAAYERTERLVVLETRASVLEAHAAVPDLLAILRINLAVGSPVVSCAQFRTVGRQCIRHQRAVLSGLLDRWVPQSGSPAFVRRVVPVLPWRAGLLYGEVFRMEGAEFLWHIGARRDEQTLAAEIYHESAPPSALRNRIHLVCDPMLATGGTQLATIERLIVAGVAPERIIAVAVVAAPEGIDFLLSRYPQLRIVTCAYDERLDERGYITGPGLGDFGDLAYADIDDVYVTEHWLASGLLTRPQADIILARMRVNGAHAAK